MKWELAEIFEFLVPRPRCQRTETSELTEASDILVPRQRCQLTETSAFLVLEVMPANVLVPETCEAVAIPSVLLVGPTDTDEVDGLPPEKGILTVERCARPVSKSDVPIPAAVMAEAHVANVASHATTVSPAAWLLQLRRVAVE